VQPSEQVFTHSWALSCVGRLPDWEDGLAHISYDSTSLAATRSCRFHGVMYPGPQRTKRYYGVGCHPGRLKAPCDFSALKDALFRFPQPPSESCEG
jgi:hypothetical protein